MRYFFLIYALLLLLVILVLPNRFGKFSEPEWRIFPDMDEQDKLLGQRSSHFFADGRGARIPDKNIVPMGFEPLSKENRGELPEFGFTNDTGYVFTGKKGDALGSGIPFKELGVKFEFGPDGKPDLRDINQLLAHGQERYGIHCSACHGMAGDGKGVIPKMATDFGGAADLISIPRPEGQIFHVITNGTGGMMGSLKHNTSIRDRWAIITYLNALREAKKKADEKK